MRQIRLARFALITKWYVAKKSVDQQSEKSADSLLVAAA